MSSDYKDIKKLLDLSEAMLTGKDPIPMNEEADPEKRKAKRAKLDADLMALKVEKLNDLIQDKYYDANEDLDEARMFQFHFEDKGSHYEFSMPLTIVFGKKSRSFAARYWDELFRAADIRVQFENNIEEALKKAGAISLTMRIDKDVEQEI